MTYASFTKANGAPGRRAQALPIWPVFVLSALLYVFSTWPSNVVFILAVFLLATQIVRKGLFLSPFRVVFPMLILLLIAVFVEMIQFSPNIAGAFKGAFYLIRLPVFFYLGFYVAKSHKDEVIESSLVIAGFAISIEYLARYNIDASILDVSRNYIRQNIGTGSLLTWIAAGLALLSILKRGKRFKGANAIYFVVFAVSIISTVVSTSRSGLIFFALLAIATLAILHGWSRWITWTTAFAAIYWLLVFTPLTQMAFNLDLSHMKIGGFAELSYPEFGNLSDINEHWRGYEIQKAFEYVFFKESSLALLFGTGLSSEVPLGIVQSLDGRLVTTIPIFHNAYSFLLVRGGIVSISVFIFLLIELSRYVRKYAKTRTNLSVVAAACMIFAAFSIPSTASLFNQNDFGQILPIILGISFERARRHNLSELNPSTQDISKQEP